MNAQKNTMAFTIPRGHRSLSLSLRKPRASHNVVQVEGSTHSWHTNFPCRNSNFLNGLCTAD